jgi:hypothetical protein
MDLLERWSVNHAGPLFGNAVPMFLVIVRVMKSAICSITKSKGVPQCKVLTV